MNLRVREGSLEDGGSLVRILTLCPEAGAGWEPALRETLAGRTTRRCLVAELDGRVAGLLLAECPVAGEAEILTVAVEPAARGRRLGYALVQAFLASRQGQVFLEVRRSNIAAQRLYAKAGFARAGVRSNYYSDPPEDACVFKWNRS
jgi:ribosomal-protein-alanine N-acetyltransferase